MSKINRQGSNQILSNSVEYHNFVFLAGMTADDLSLDVTGQTKQVIAKIDAALEANGTDKSRLLNAQIWLKDIRDRDAMNKDHDPINRARTHAEPPNHPTFRQITPNPIVASCDALLRNFPGTGFTPA